MLFNNSSHTHKFYITGYIRRANKVVILINATYNTRLSVIAYPSVIRQPRQIFQNSMKSGDKCEAPNAITRTRPLSFFFILLKTNLSHIGDGFVPCNKARLLTFQAILNSLSFRPTDVLTALMIPAYMLLFFSFNADFQSTLVYHPL